MEETTQARDQMYNVSIVGVMDMKCINVCPLGIPSKKYITRINKKKVISKGITKLLDLLIVLLHNVILESMKSHIFYLIKML